ncbi:MAG: excinuclease ABC subunit C, partial [Actinobacteria bacterium]|nr:excinuclease ABC subunit C [Actinomycetota bacterium]
VGSMVVFEDGLSRRDAYRRFEVKTVAGSDDFAAMREVLRRRLAYLQAPRDRDGPQRFGYRPQLLVIDGGKGQLSEAVAAIAELNIEPAPVVIGLAKRYEEIFVPGRSAPIILDRQSPALFLLQQLRDEAHRFAIGFHRQRRGKAMVESLLDGVAGLGPRRRAQLLERFGTVSAVREASLEELQSLGWLPAEVAEGLWNRLRGLDPREVAHKGPEDQEWSNG